MFEACSARPPVALPFQVRTADLTTAAGASTCLGGWHRRYDMPPRAPSDARKGAPGPFGFGCRGGVVRLVTPITATASSPYLLTSADTLDVERIFSSYSYIRTTLWQAEKCANLGCFLDGCGGEARAGIREGAGTVKQGERGAVLSYGVSPLRLPCGRG